MDLLRCHLTHRVYNLPPKIHCILEDLVPNRGFSRVGRPPRRLGVSGPDTFVHAQHLNLSPNTFKLLFKIFLHIPIAATQTYSSTNRGN
ncbi:hypothetical protein QQP08_000396 [Theobroma cacao]|nr:hypothetical protein QQP08_000396 [Theobroma cacao]